MRTNLPVTQNEVVIKDGDFIVSKTDLKGQITYINRTFIEVSGFTEAELIGQPHNLVRHPDMPVEAFADLWNSLKAGRPWTGLVKNRCKNGDYYWVMANATPMFENGQVVGYMSVRTKPRPDQVAAADAAYRAFREKRAKGLMIRDGQVVSSGFHPVRWLKERTIAQRIYGICGLLVLGMLLAGGLGILAVEKERAAIEELSNEHLLVFQKMNAIANAYAVDIVDNSHKARDGALDYAAALKNVEQAQVLIQKEWQAYNAIPQTDEEKKVTAEIAALMKTGDAATDRLKELLRRGDRGALATFAAQNLYPAIDPVAEKIGQLASLQLREAQQLSTESAKQARALEVRLLTVMLVVVAIALFMVWTLVRSIRQPIADIAMFFRYMAEGRVDAQIDSSRRDEISMISDAARSMQIKSGFDINDARQQADEMTRIKIALDNVSTGVMIADAGRNIIYANDSVKRILKTAESDLKKVLPTFSADRLIGENIDQFHKNPAHQAELLAKLGNTHVAKLRIGERHMVVTASPVINTRGDRLGAVAEWQDRTAEVKVEEEVADIVSAASVGDLSKRIDLAGKEGFFAALGQGLNQLLDNTDQALQTTSEVLAKVAQGDLTQTVEAQFGGIFGQLKDDTNATVERLREVVGRIADATDAINTAAQEIASGNSDLSSRTEEQASSLEETASSMEELTSTVKQNADNARSANDLAGSAQQVAERGGAVVGQVVETMGAIHQSSSKIADIIGVIDGIAFQTNILALNAAVEAARAGEQGRGFAVVATEVRNLAQRSAAAAKEIKGLISDSVGKVEAGSKLVNTAGQTMEEVVASIKRVAQIMADISEASREQSSGIEQVSLAVSQMDEVNQQNAALVEEAAAAAESLEEQARTLAQAVAVFRVSERAQPQARLGRATRAPREERAAAPKGRTERVGGRKAPPALPASLDDEWEEF